jgi:hypothetical protein
VLAELHVWGLPALHCFSPAVQARHCPPLQGAAVHVMVVDQWPVASQD